MKKIALLLTLALLSACSFRSPQSQFYVMNSNNLSSLSTKKMNIAVARVDVPDMLNKSQMVIYDDNSIEVQILEFHRWAEVFPNMIQSTVTNDLMAYLPNSFVRDTYFDNDTAQYNISIEINRIEAHKGGDVRLSAWWNIRNNQGKIIKQVQHTYISHTKGNSMSDLVDAQTDAVHQMSRDIAENLLSL